MSLSLLNILGYFGLPACTRIPLDPTTKIPITLAANDLNRLSLKEGRISAVYGADIFHVELDAKHGQVFLHLKKDVELPGQVSLAITTEEGLTQDLEIFFTEDPAKPIVFEVPPERHSLRKDAQQFFYDVLAGKTENCIIQEGHHEENSGMNKTINLGWGTMTLTHRILSPHFPFVVDYYDLVGHKPYCQYKLRHNLFTSLDTHTKTALDHTSICGVWLSDRIVRGKRPVTVAILRQRRPV